MLDEKLLCESKKVFEERQKRFEKILIRMEVELTTKLNILLNDSEVQNDANERILQSLDRIEDRLDRQERELFLVKRSR